MSNIIVTGGTRGIGLAITKALMDAYHVIVVARRPSDTLPDGVSFISWDLSQLETLRQLAAKLRSEHGRIYGLVNNAGIGTAGILLTMSDSTIADIMQMNVVAPITLTKHVLRSMMAARQGRIVNISSIVANTGFQGLSAYSASKAALQGFTRSLAREVGPLGITVNAVAPGFVDTEMTHGLDQNDREKIAKRSALKRVPRAEDIAIAVRFLLSDAAENITGTVITVDAGNTA